MCPTPCPHLAATFMLPLCTYAPPLGHTPCTHRHPPLAHLPPPPPRNSPVRCPARPDTAVMGSPHPTPAHPIPAHLRYRPLPEPPWAGPGRAGPVPEPVSVSVSVPVPVLGGAGWARCQPAARTLLPAAAGVGPGAGRGRRPELGGLRGGSAGREARGVRRGPRRGQSRGCGWVPGGPEMAVWGCREASGDASGPRDAEGPRGAEGRSRALRGRGHSPGQGPAALRPLESYRWG